MAIPAANIWEVETGGSDTLNGGGFDPSNSSMATDGAAASANTSAPVFTSASYNFVAGDVGAWLFIKSGTNWTPSWYKIASVASNAATLSGAIGAAVLVTSNVPSGLNTVVGCATTASPTGATWSVDYSQQAAVANSLTGLTTAAANAIILTSAATKAMVGNGIVITGGTNFTTGYYSISSVSAGVSITVDRTCTSAAGALGTAGVGGALVSPGFASGQMVANNSMYIRSGTYSITSASVNVSNGCIQPIGGAFTNASCYIGYGSVRCDLGTKPLLQLNVSTAIAINRNGTSPSYVVVSNLNIDGNNQTSSTGIFIHAYAHVVNCLVQNCTNTGIKFNAVQNVVYNTRVTGCSTSGNAILGVTDPYDVQVIGCQIDTNSVTGVNGCQIIDCLIYNNSGASTDGCVDCPLISNSTFYGMGRNGIYVHNSGTGDGIEGMIINSISYGNSSYAVSSSRASSTVHIVNLAAGNNTSGRLGQTFYVEVNPVTLTGNPFTNVAGGDFSLNNTSGAGAACRAAGFPGVFPGGTTTGYLDIGAAQHADPSSASPNYGIRTGGRL